MPGHIGIRGNDTPNQQAELAIRPIDTTKHE